MKVAAIRSHGGPEAVVIEDWPQPAPKPSEMLIKVEACGLNYLDVFVRRGMPGVKIELPRIGGGDVAGRVETVGSNVDPSWIGRAVVLNPKLPSGGVLGEHMNGGLCEFMTAPEGQVLARPETLDAVTAAAIPITFGTAHRMLITRASLQPGETVLVLGASGGVGTACVQLARHLGAKVIACTSSSEKAARLRDLGADHVLDGSEESIATEVWKLTSKRGVDLAINYTGGDTWGDCLRATRKGGRLLTCGATAGHDCVIDMRFVWVRELTILGSTGYRQEDIAAMVAAVADGAMRPLIDKVLPLDRTAEGMQMLEDRTVIGKVVVTP